MEITILEYSPHLSLSDMHASEGLSCGSHCVRTGNPMHLHADISIVHFGSNKIRTETFFLSQSVMNDELATYE